MYATSSSSPRTGAIRHGPRPEPKTATGSVYQALIPRVDTNMGGSPDYEGAHGGEDVPLYSIGSGSEAVSGVIEQNRVFDIMMNAFGWDTDE